MTPTLRVGLLAFLLLVGLMVGVGLYNQRLARSAAALETATRESDLWRARALRETARGDSVEARFRTLTVRYRAAEAQRTIAKAASDTALAAARATQDSARQVLADSAASRTQLREQLAAVLEQGLKVDAVVVAERRASDKAVTAADATIDTAEQTVQLKDGAIAASDSAYRAEHRVAELERGQRPPWYARAVGGLVSGGATLLCGGVGYVLAGPLGALGGGATCAVVSGIVRR